MHRNAIFILLLSVAGLTALGVVMLFSTSAFAQESHGDIYFFVKRQVVWLGVAAVGAVAAGCIDYTLWRKIWWLLFAGAFVFLLLCFIPPFGLRINGSSRWVNLGFLTFQPSEIAKVAALFFVAWWYDHQEKKVATLWSGLVLPWIILAALIVPILGEVDLGTSALIGVTSLTVMFLGGASLRWLSIMALGGLAGVGFLITQIEERMGRMMAFMDPAKYSLGEGLQQLQALIAFGSGGLEGLGLGDGRQKFLYLPYAHTDFIFPMIGEELGLRVTLLTVLGYLLICLCGIIVATNSRDRFGRLLGYGCVMMISFQAVVNIAVTTSLMPNKGMPLPFISFGGSNLVVCYFMIGILVNIYRHGNPLTESVTPQLRAVRSSCKL